MPAVIESFLIMWITAGASKVSLSSLSAQELWEQSGRLKEGSEVWDPLCSQ